MYRGCLRPNPLTNQSLQPDCDSHPVTCAGLSPVRLGVPIGQRGSHTHRRLRNQSFSTEDDIISPTGTQLFLSTPPPSEPPVPGPLNLSIASRSSSSSPNNFAPIDFTSFTTDYQPQTWLPSPPHPQPLASNQNNNSNNNSVHEDFVLYPSSPHPQPRLRVPVKATHRPSALQPFLAQNNPRRHSFSLQLQRHLQQQYSSPQDPRVTQLARSPSYWSHPTLKHARQHTASVPSNSPNTNRPPIPLFNGQQNQPSNTQPYRRVMSTPNFAMEADLFDLNSSGIPSAGFSAGMDSPLAFDALDQTGLLPSGPPGTISPRDLMMDASVPPSGTFTDLSTPSFESPGNFSQNASPMFTDLDLVGHEEWPSLFDGASDMNAFDLANLDSLNVAAGLQQEPKKPALKVETTPRSPLKRPASSMASSPIPATGGTKHSSISGVNARSRKNLSPVDFDPNDPVAAKRARNTEAARKSRAKKMERQADSERRIDELNEIIAARDAEIAKLKAQLQIQNTYQ
ncbi:unnamed protein product [Penicillium salamii]|uniref:BZIP domain-containing protein n=1 Tax=Penicillium salamii TaxID=1612424 RepID=A0A9W4I6R7_9EURO|nr:unnamed protein product [Penicillium salamii]CAG8154703.1 unnamed protein product [Penicillium salamii]CAG8233678.1 unnamed protein product [Penicillium salamii]CAG8257036.1 unnamed protein product [Penicillium salamii]CAG8381277.1 unnamed protein product [Penicillium salamii]